MKRFVLRSYLRCLPAFGVPPPLLLCPTSVARSSVSIESVDVVFCNTRTLGTDATSGALSALCSSFAVSPSPALLLALFMYSGVAAEPGGIGWFAGSMAGASEDDENGGADVFIQSEHAEAAVTRTHTLECDGVKTAD